MFKKIFKNPYVLAFIAGIICLHLIKELAKNRRSIPEPMVIVSDWSLTDQNENIKGKSELLHKPFIASFFFTSCPTICPKLMQQMKEVYKRFIDKQNKINFISITVDPEQDTPKVLSDYMKKMGIEYPNWFCLTGTEKSIYEVVVNKMKVHIGDKQEIEGAEGIYDIPHLAHLALFDSNGNLRGLFKTSNDEMAALVRAANFLIEQQEQDK